MPAISLPPLALAFFAADGVAEDPEPVEEAPVEVVVAGAFRSRVCPIVGKAGLPFTDHPPGVDVGHTGGERPEADAE